MLKIIRIRAFCLMASIAVYALPAMATDLGTSLDNNNYIQFTYDTTPSIKIAPKSNSPANQSCNATEAGALRYNSNPALKTIEFCNATKWTPLGGKYYGHGDPIKVDYSQCVPATKDHSGTSLYTYYQSLGASGSHVIHIACPKNYVMVAGDASKKSDIQTYTDGHCCKLKIH